VTNVPTVLIVSVFQWQEMQLHLGAALQGRCRLAQKNLPKNK